MLSSRPPRAAMALFRLLEALDEDAQCILCAQMCNVLEPRRAVYLSSVSHGLRVLMHRRCCSSCGLTTRLPQAGHTVRAATCKELREARKVEWENKSLFRDRADIARHAGLGARAEI